MVPDCFRISIDGTDTRLRGQMFYKAGPYKLAAVVPGIIVILMVKAICFAFLYKFSHYRENHYRLCNQRSMRVAGIIVETSSLRIIHVPLT